VSRHRMRQTSPVDDCFPVKGVDVVVGEAPLHAHTKMRGASTKKRRREVLGGLAHRGAWFGSRMMTARVNSGGRGAAELALGEGYTPRRAVDARH
jgi:hypothetical protein